MSTSALSVRPTAAPLLLPALIACYVVWGSTYLAIRLALVSFPPFFQMGTRFLAAGALLMAWVLWQARARRAVLPTPREWRNALFVGGLMLGGGMGLTASAEQHVGSGLVAAFIAVVPMLVCGWGLLFGQRPHRLAFAGMAVGVAGVLMLARGASFSASPTGFACLAGATLAWSLGSVLSTTRLPLALGAAGFASEMLCGGAVLMTFSLALGEQFSLPPQPLALAAWAYLVVFGSLIGFSAYLYLLANASAAVATSLRIREPGDRTRTRCFALGRDAQWRRMDRMRRDSRGRAADLQRENSVFARIKKQHLPMKNRVFRLDAPFFSISIRSASESAVFHWW